MEDIYESSDAVRNYEVMIKTEMMSTERQQELQHTGRVSVKNRRHRSVQVCLCLLSVLLFTAVIVICVYFTNQLLTHNYNLTKDRGELITHNLTEEREKFRNKSDELQHGLYEKDQRPDNFKWTYYISSEYKSLSDSRRDCEQKGADLLIINNKEEQEYLQKAIAGRYYYWIGLSKEGGVWKWVDGTTLILSFWINGNPRHSHTCAVTSSSGWVSHSCNGYERWICEKRILESPII
nr:CD209 antigen-like protein E [Misgurnus anguillicaudatus]